ncbi:hypothetical protein ACHAWF_004362 [Thalassiosira exigua]
MCDALAFAHEKGVVHHDVKSANILIDASAGGKLLLADFGTALKPGEETVGFTKSYASPELLASHELEDFAGLRPDKIDSFALGAVIYELLMCKRLEDLSSDQTLAEFIADGPGLDAAMTLDTILLPWLPPNTSSCPPFVGYTHELKNLIMNLLKPNINERLLPGQLQHALRNDPLSPLLLPNITAAQTANPGDLITIDNVQLGMLCQRGPDWADGDDDGGVGSIGVVVKLDGDGTYVDVAFPSRKAHPIEATCYRMGANNKYELQAGPCQMPDYVQPGSIHSRQNGTVLVGKNASNMSVGQMLNPNCMVVGINVPLGVAFVAPMEKMSIPPTLRRPIVWKTNNESFVSSREQTHHPEAWQLNLGPLVSIVLNSDEGKDVLNFFCKKSGGLNRRECAVQSIIRVQDTWLWDSYNRGREKVSNDNWGIENEIRAFMISPVKLDNSNLQDFNSDGNQFSTKPYTLRSKSRKKSEKAESQMLLCRIFVGRVFDEAGKSKTWYGSSLKGHSELIRGDLFVCRGTCLAYPEYIINYIDNSSRDHNNESEGTEQQPGRSESKMCILCMERPVRYLTLPCGHPCLCEKCNAPQIRSKLKGKCPECRARFYNTAIVYGRVVNDE